MKIKSLERALQVAHENDLGLTGLRALIAITTADATDDTVLTLTGVAEATGVSTAAITGQTDRLERAGLVNRIHSKADRRRVYMTITDKGAEIIKQILNA